MLKILICLSVMLTSCSLSAESVAVVEWDLAVQKGRPAPFSGVLVPEDSYRFYQTDAELFRTCDARLRASVGRCPEAPERWLTQQNFLLLILGLAAGSLYQQEKQ